MFQGVGHFEMGLPN